jgi:hypothetical protein
MVLGIRDWGLGTGDSGLGTRVRRADSSDCYASSLGRALAGIVDIGCCSGSAPAPASWLRRPSWRSWRWVGCRRSRTAWSATTTNARSTSASTTRRHTGSRAGPRIRHLIRFTASSATGRERSGRRTPRPFTSRARSLTRSVPTRKFSARCRSSRQRSRRFDHLPTPHRRRRPGRGRPQARSVHRFHFFGRRRCDSRYWFARAACSWR